MNYLNEEKNNMPTKLQQIMIYILGGVLVIGGVVFAGLLDPLLSPAPTSNTLDDIYYRLQDNTYSPPLHLLDATNPPESSMHDLSDIYGSITPFYNTAFNLGSSTGYSLGYDTGINIGSSTGYSTGYDAGLATNPTENNVRSSIAYGNGQIGTIVLPDISNVLAGIHFGASSELTGTLPASIYPSPSQVLNGISFGDNSALTGNVVLPSAGSVISTATFGPSSGTTGMITVKTGDNAVTTTSTSTNKLLLTVPVGYYGGSATVSTTSTAFTSANIAFGVNLFGITGTYTSASTEWSSDMPGGLTHTWQEGVDYCAGTVDGSTGWHLPHEWELIKYNEENGQGTFQGAGNYWSSHEYGIGGPIVSSFAVDMTTSVVFNAPKMGLAYVRCAR